MNKKTLARMQREYVGMNQRLAKCVDNYRLSLRDTFDPNMSSDSKEISLTLFLVRATGAVGDLAALMYCGGRHDAEDFVPKVQGLVELRLDEAYAVDLRELSTHHTLLTANFFHQVNSLRILLDGQIDERALRRASEAFESAYEKEEAPMSWRAAAEQDFTDPGDAARECVGQLLLGEGGFVLDYMKDFPMSRINSLKPDAEPDMECLIVAYFTALEQMGQLQDGDKMGQKAHAMTLAWEWLREWAVSVPPVDPVDMFTLWAAMLHAEGRTLDPDAILEDLRPQSRFEALQKVGRR